MAFESANVEIINLDKRIIVMTDGMLLPIAEFFDDEGDYCEPSEAVVCVAGVDGYGWVTVEIFPADTWSTVH